MNKSMLTGLVAGAVIVTAGGAVAGLKKWNESNYAEVVSATPAMETVRTPRQDCKDVVITEQAPVKDQRRITGTVLGAVVGGVLGNQVGGGDGKKIATVAGAAGGAYAGNKIQQKAQQKNTVTRTVQDCKTVYDEHQKQAGFDVTYRFKGQESTVRMDHDPGKRIPVKDGQVVLTQTETNAG